MPRGDFAIDVNAVNNALNTLRFELINRGMARVLYPDFPEKLKELKAYIAQPKLPNEYTDQWALGDDTYIHLVFENNGGEGFKAWLEERFNVKDNPKANELYYKAYEKGHDHGYYEVYLVYKDLVDLIK